MILRTGASGAWPTFFVEVGNEFAHDAGDVAFTPDGVDEFEA
jgi:hypothetical protein